MEQNPKLESPGKEKVVSLAGVSYSAGLGPDKDIVDRLEKLLEEAKKGEIIGFSYALVRPGYETVTDWCKGRSGRHPMVSSVSSLFYDFMAANSFDSA